MFGRKDLIERLIELDNELYLLSLSKHIHLDSKIEIVIVGSSCLLLRCMGRSTTNDIDIIKLSHEIPNSILEKYDMNINASYIMRCFPDNFESRLEEISIQCKVCTYYTLSLEDSIASKLVANRPKDQKDISDSNLISQIDFLKLAQIMEEFEYSLGTRELREVFQLYNNYLDDCTELLHQNLSNFKKEV